MRIVSKSVFLVFVLPALVTACWSDYGYEYISLTKSMEVLDYGNTELTNVRAHSSMPIRYMLERDQYTLYGSVDRLSILPAALFSIEGKTLFDAKIRGDNIHCFGFFEEVAPVQIDHYGYREGSIRFTWNPVGDRICANEIAPVGEGRKIVISIMNGVGKIVAEEEILFDIVTNGIYREFDCP